MIERSVHRGAAIVVGVVTATLTACAPLATTDPASATPAATTPAATAPTDALPPPSAAAIERDIRWLADDARGGREAGSVEYEAAAHYVAQRFREVGLRPVGGGESRDDANEDSAWFQTVPLRGTRRVPAKAALVLHPANGGADVALQFKRDYLVARSQRSAYGSVTAPLVFAGFGIVSARHQRDDYAGLDARGKIVVLLSGVAPGLPSEEAAYFVERQQEEAAAHGAVGVITVSTREAQKAFPWADGLKYLTTEGMGWRQSDGTPFDPTAQLVAVAKLSASGARRLFAGAPRGYEPILDEAEHGNPRGFDLPLSATISQGSALRDLSSPNVIGLIPGRDPKLADEVIVLSAHLDHLGRRAAAPGQARGQDLIYNGALDNAAGIATMIEAARLFGASGRAPRRTLLFLASTGEEKGLLGAEYFAHHPRLPPGARIVGNVDLDMPLLSFDFADVVAFGADHSSIGQSVQRAAARIGVTLSPDPWPEQVIFVRSDHYRFVQQGIPAVFLVTGVRSTDPAEDGTKLWEDFLAHHYHDVSDDTSQPLRYDIGAKFALVNYLVTREMADADSPPAWKPGDFFGEVFAPAPQSR